MFILNFLICKILFFNRLLGTIVPFIITIPLALMGYGAYSIIIGTLIGNIIKSANLIINSKWKPKFFFSYYELANMFKFSSWTIIESFCLWLVTWIDIFLISNKMGNFYTGIYKNCQSTVTGIITIITSSIGRVLFSSLSKIQSNDAEFKRIFLLFQKYMSIILFPMGLGILIYRGTLVRILLGEKWLIGSDFFGLWGFSMSLVAIYGTPNVEAYRAKGMPKLSSFIQLLHIIFIIPICIYGVNKGFKSMVLLRSLGYLQILILHFYFTRKYLEIGIKEILKNTYWPLVSSLVMLMFGILFNMFLHNTITLLLSIILCMLIYFAVLFISKDYRTIFKFIVKSIVSILK
ncbi:hypothetical protein DXB22_12190 [Clostridiaceae bacterium OM02-2AC]|nr:hypothetical protein DXB22_12190 [Clostridiaceae bacterium OM02-2AC]